MFSKKNSNFHFSPLSRQGYRSGGMRRSRSRHDDHAPGSLFKYISAGGIEKGIGEYRDNRSSRPRSPLFVYLAAIALFVIWLIY